MQQISDYDNAMLELMSARDTLHRQKSSLVTQAKNDRATASERLRSGDKTGAVSRCRMWKERERLAALVEPHLLKLETSIANSETQRDVLAATQVATDALKAVRTEMGDVEGLLMEFEEVSSDLERVGQFFGNTVDRGDAADGKAALDAELESLMLEAMSNRIEWLPPVPSSIQSHKQDSKATPTTAVQSKAKTEEGDPIAS